MHLKLTTRLVEYAPVARNVKLQREKTEKVDLTPFVVLIAKDFILAKYFVNYISKPQFL
jgi:hypothetical protein